MGVGIQHPIFFVMRKCILNYFKQFDLMKIDMTDLFRGKKYLFTKPYFIQMCKIIHKTLMEVKARTITRTIEKMNTFLLWRSLISFLLHAARILVTVLVLKTRLWSIFLKVRQLPRIDGTATFFTNHFNCSFIF